MTFSVLLSAALLTVGSVRAAPTPSGPNTTATCTNKYGPGQFATNQYADSKGQLVFEPYYFDSEGFVAFDPSGQHDVINAVFQTCTPNYAQKPNGNDDDDLYGRFFIPSLNKCLAVTNPSGSPPYYLGTSDCPSAQDMTGPASVPFNFIADGSGGDVDMRWLGGSIPSKSVYQAGSQACHGELFVNATNLQHGYKFDGLGQPNTEDSGAEDKRIHLYCNQGTGFNSFTVPLRG